MESSSQAPSQFAFYSERDLFPSRAAIDSAQKLDAYAAIRRNLYERMLHLPVGWLKGRKVLDLGCGTGDFGAGVGARRRRADIGRCRRSCVARARRGVRSVRTARPDRCDGDRAGRTIPTHRYLRPHHGGRVSVHMQELRRRCAALVPRAGARWVPLDFLPRRTRLVHGVSQEGGVSARLRASRH